jgi:Protein of unknown function (DUF3102).
MSNRLPALRGDIACALKEASEAAALATQRFMDAGAALNEAKSLCAHGEWLPFLRDIGIHERTAQRYMKLAAGRLKPDFVSDLGGVAAALQFLSYRDAAMRHFDDAEAAAKAHDAGEEVDLLSPIERAMDCFDQMVAMLPSQQEGRA